MKRFMLGLAIAVGSVFLLHALLLWWVHRTVRERISSAATACGAEWVNPERTTLAVDLLGGDIRIVDLRWVRTGSPMGSMPALSGTLDSLFVVGLSYRRLYVDGIIDMDRLLIHGSDITVEFHEAATTRSTPSSIHGSSVKELDFAFLRSNVALQDSTRIASGSLAVEGRSIGFDSADFQADVLEAKLLGTRVTPFADSILTVQRIALSQSGTRLSMDSVVFGPADVRSVAAGVPIERDVIAGVVDRIVVAGIDPGSCKRGVVRARSIRIDPAVLSVARDKLNADPPFKHKPLPARLLRALPMNAGFDSVIIEAMDVSYYERVDAVRGFAHIPFDSIAAVVTNLRHIQGDTLRMIAMAQAFDHTPVRLEMRCSVGDTSDRLFVNAMVGELRFARLNNVLAPLTGVATPEGRLDTLILRMTGDDDLATAKCWMRYDRLRVDRRGRKGNVLDPVINGIMNAVVKGGRTGEKDGDGWTSYAWDRRRDRSLFNYLWAGVREGAKHSMLPQVVLDRTTNR